MPCRARARILHALPLLLAAGALTGCGAGADLPSVEDARTAGQDYGRAIVDTVGERATREEMEALCGQAARDDAPPADETVNAFIDGCMKALTDQQ